MTDSSPANHENYRYYPPLDGGGLRWDWTWYVSPSPPPSPARGEGDNRVIFEAIERKGGKQCGQVIFLKLSN